jgi:hypothetical protein
MDYAYEWIISNGGIDTEKDYPYTATDTVCDNTKEHHVAVAVTSFEDIPPNNEAAIKKAATVQPVSIAIAASGLPFQLYSHGVFNGSCSTQLDHGVLIVGYDTDAETGQEYWIVKNSWGEVWGEQGFIRMAMNHAPAGLCGLAMVPSFPVVKKGAPPTPGPTPPPGPGPTPPATITCDSKSGSSCPSTSTCCCTLKLPVINYCVQWGCWCVSGSKARGRAHVWTCLTFLALFSHLTRFFPAARTLVRRAVQMARRAALQTTRCAIWTTAFVPARRPRRSRPFLSEPSSPPPVIFRGARCCTL